MSWESINWHALERLRGIFLQGTAAAGDYWRSESDLAAYDLTFAQRIGWKWDWVLADLARLGWRPPAGTLLDWGCGSGIAHRAWIDHFGAADATGLHLWDRSVMAVQFATRRATTKYPGLPVEGGLTEAPAVLLLSHVLAELQPQPLAQLETLALRSQAVVWVEPGTAESGRALIAVRERLRGHLHLVAPCPHQACCGLLAAGHERHWCHHFATPPPFVFTDGDWATFGRVMGIDLRSVPLSYLVLDRRPPPNPPQPCLRVLGRPRVYKAHAMILGCEEAGVREHRLDKRTLPGPFKDLRKGRCPSLPCWRSERGVIVDPHTAMPPQAA